MTLEKAIEVNTQELAPLLVGKKIEWQEAFGLGIEALKAVGNLRVANKYTIIPLLLGETEEK